jgi:hypothetical protein
MKNLGRNFQKNHYLLEKRRAEYLKRKLCLRWVGKKFTLADQKILPLAVWPFALSGKILSNLSNESIELEAGFTGSRGAGVVNDREYMVLT